MFLQSQKDIQPQHNSNQHNLTLRALKPKLITSLNYQQEYLLRRKQKRNNRRKGTRQKSSNSSNGHTRRTGSEQLIEGDSNNDMNSYGNDQNYDSSQDEIQNNFYKEVYDGNDKISGYWLNGLLQGQAEIQYQNGDYFKGKFEKGYKVQGLMMFKDQGSYEGAFYNQQFHGKGVLRLKDKTISADWVNGIVQSSSIVEYKNGNVYYGPLKDFKKHGYGYLYFPNDSKFFGQFVDGMVKGYGQFYQKGKLKCKGLWKNGKLIQEKREQDWSYNFQDQNINWQLIQELFSKRDMTNCVNCFQIFNLKPFQQNDLLKNSDSQNSSLTDDGSQNSSKQETYQKSKQKNLLTQPQNKHMQNIMKISNNREQQSNNIIKSEKLQPLQELIMKKCHKNNNKQEQSHSQQH